VKYGIIADIHSNLEALDVVLAELRSVDRLVCLGDLVGYGPNPNECVEKIRDLKIPVVAGNHDKAVANELEDSWFSPEAREAIAWTQEVITGDNLKYLKGLPEVLEEDDFVMVHGSLRSPIVEYIASLSEAMPTFEKMTKSLCLVGHTHIPVCISQTKDGRYDSRELKDKSEVNVGEYQKLIVNVGGVGQPRDGDPRAGYGIYNTETRIIKVFRTEYNFKSTQEKMEKVGLPYSLIRRLAHGL
jgi:predicted phosphodiesterase